MKPGFSIWLDLMRAFAAFMVLLGHSAHPRFTDGTLNGMRTWNVASDFVIVFFVLSGVVIAYAAERDGTLGRFSFNRATRLWSVLLPAIILTICLDRLGLMIDPNAYWQGAFEPTTAGEMLVRGLTFSNEWSSFVEPVRLGTNAPIWSLSYEAGYYALFGAAVFLKGAVRLLCLIAIAAVVGLPILALLPAWLMGVWVWKRIKSERIISPTRAWLMFLGAPSFAVFCKLLGLHHLLAGMTAAYFAPENYKTVLYYSDEVLWNTVLAGLFALHLLGAYSLNKQLERWISGSFATIIRWAAGASFTLYAIHKPILHFTAAATPAEFVAKPVVFVAIPLIASVIFAELFERPLPKFRTKLRKLIEKGPAQSHGAFKKS